MRIAALIFALIGAAGSGFVGFAGLEAIKKSEAEAEAEKNRPGGPLKVIDQERMTHLKRAIYGMIAGIPLGVIGGVLALNRKGKLAALLLVVSYAVPLIILATGVGIDFSDNRVKPILLFPAGFLVAALCALFVKSGTPYKPAKRGTGISEDDDLVG